MESSRSPAANGRETRRSFRRRKRRRTVRVASTRREIARLTRRRLYPPDSTAPDAIILHTTYTDGGERLEVRSLDGAFPAHMFELRSEMNPWLRKLGYDV